MRLRTSASIGASFQRTSPESAASTPRTIRIVVVLPAPLLPTNPNTSPGRTVNETSDSTVRVPNRLLIPRMSSTRGP